MCLAQWRWKHIPETMVLLKTRFILEIHVKYSTEINTKVKKLLCSHISSLSACKILHWLFYFPEGMEWPAEWITELTSFFWDVTINFLLKWVFRWMENQAGKMFHTLYLCENVDLWTKLLNPFHSKLKKIEMKHCIGAPHWS